MIIQLMSRLRKSFRVELPLRDVFAMPTIKEIADMLEAKILRRHQRKRLIVCLLDSKTWTTKRPCRYWDRGRRRANGLSERIRWNSRIGSRICRRQNARCC
jgi:hypothetical protein